MEQEIEEAEQRHETRKRKILESSAKFQEAIKKVCCFKTALLIDTLDHIFTALWHMYESKFRTCGLIKIHIRRSVL